MLRKKAWRALKKLWRTSILVLSNFNKQPIAILNNEIKIANHIVSMYKCNDTLEVGWLMRGSHTCPWTCIIKQSSVMRDLPTLTWSHSRARSEALLADSLLEAPRLVNCLSAGHGTVTVHCQHAGAWLTCWKANRTLSSVFNWDDIIE